VSDELFAAAIEDVGKRTPRLLAPTLAIEALRAAATVGFEEGMAVERSSFIALRASPESRALRHAFQAERDSARLPANLTGVPSLPINTVGIVGAGTMGQGIALAFAEVGTSVRIMDSDANVLAAALDAVARTCESRVKRGKLSADQSSAILGRLQAVSAVGDLESADLVIEAVFEDPAVKQVVMRQIDAAVRSGAIIASNTSYQDIDSLAAATGRPQNVVGLHFFSPAHVMRLIEVVPGKHTAPAVQATALGLGKRLNKHAVLVGNCRGFVGNRMLARRTREAYFLLEEGATPAQVDRAFTDFGFPMGPFAVGDLAGLDIGWRNRRTNFEQLTPREQACDILDRLIEAGRLGQKAGRGFYTYDEQRRAQPDVEVESIIAQHSKRVGIGRRIIESREILERCLFAMIDEGARILGEGYARSSSDIDVVWLHGYGFPRHRGGPMHYADEMGLASIRKAILGFQAQFGPEYWSVAPLLAQLAASDGKFKTWRKPLQVEA
jgi:3-hydroxyacyl-CoA dehydrogenase